MHESQGTLDSFSGSAGDERSVLGRLEIRAAPAEVAPARHWLCELLAPDHAAIVEDVVVMAGEAITNSICHSESGRPDEQGEPGSVTLLVWDIEGTIRVEVIDAGSQTSVPKVIDDGLDALSGRGLHMIELLSSGRWGTCAHGEGRTVWFECTTCP
jgi:anti-sigma regulatory factor (Ser/Thr protein kinase)